MMSRTKTNSQILLLTLSVGLAGTFLNAEARPLIQKTLFKGDSWMLTVDGERDSLVIHGGKGRQTTSGGFKLNYQVAWGEHNGVLKAVSDGNNLSQFVTLQLIRTNGIRVECRGYIARETANFMAGTCGSKSDPGAWYAVRSGSELASTESAKENSGACGKQEQSCKLKVDRLMMSNRELNNKYLTANKVKQRCQSLLKQCYQEQQDTSSQALSKKPFYSFKNKVDGTYYGVGSSNERADSQVQKLNSPKRPGSSSNLGKWLRHHNGALLDVTYGVLNSSDRDRFSSQESQECSGNIYCEMAFRQQVIRCALGLGC